MTETAQRLLGDPAFRVIESEIERRHDESVGRLQDWVKHPALAAEDRGMDEGCDLMMRLAKDAGFQNVEIATAILRALGERIRSAKGATAD